MPVKKPVKRAGRDIEREIVSEAPVAPTRPGPASVQFGPTKSVPGSRLKGGK
jgi:hypothetical protein